MVEDVFVTLMFCAVIVLVGVVMRYILEDDEDDL